MKIEIPSTAQELVEKWLPNYHNRINEWVAEELRSARFSDTQEKRRLKHNFQRESFPEALTAFAEAVAKEQRDICQGIIDENFDNGADYAEQAHVLGWLYRSDAILSSPSPVKPKTDEDGKYKEDYLG